MGCLGSLMGCLNKTILYVLNLVLFLFGLGVVIIASLALAKNEEYGDLLAEGTFTFPIIILIIGIFILFLGFFGCCGAKKDSSCMLYTYASILLVLVIAQVTCGILLLVYKDTAEDFIKDGMQVAFNKYDNPTDEAFTTQLDKIQNKLECCGVVGPTDWKNATYMDGESVADGCCITMKNDCGKAYYHDIVNGPEPIYTAGCYDTIKEDLLSLGIGITGLILAAAGVQLIIVILACILAKKNDD